MSLQLKTEIQKLQENKGANDRRSVQRVARAYAARSDDLRSCANEAKARYTAAGYSDAAPVSGSGVTTEAKTIYGVLETMATDLSTIRGAVAQVQSGIEAAVLSAAPQGAPSPVTGQAVAPGANPQYSGAPGGKAPTPKIESVSDLVKYLGELQEELITTLEELASQNSEVARLSQVETEYGVFLDALYGKANV
jgi:hypothetical protein